jgi:hypothetical protein
MTDTDVTFLPEYHNMDPSRLYVMILTSPPSLPLSRTSAGVFSYAVAVVFVDSCYHMTHVVGFEECRHLFIEIFPALVGAQCTRMSSQLCDQATVCVNEVVLVREKFHVFGTGVGAYEDYEVLVSAGRLGSDLAAEVVVDIFQWNVGSLLLPSMSRAAWRF